MPEAIGFKSTEVADKLIMSSFLLLYSIITIGESLEYLSEQFALKIPRAIFSSVKFLDISISSLLFTLKGTNTKTSSMLQASYIRTPLKPWDREVGTCHKCDSRFEKNYERCKWCKA